MRRDAVPTPDLPFRVRIVESTNGRTGDPTVVARFSRQVAAEAFIQSEIIKCESFGSEAGRYWARNSPEHQVYYWIETDQETGSVEEAKASASDKDR